MVLHTVNLVPGTETPVGEGINRPSRCVVRFPDLSTRAAILKRLTPQGVAAEVFCALLLRGWGLSVPEPAIVNGVSGASIAFGSIDAGYPNLKQTIGWSDSLSDPVKNILIDRGSRLVSGFTETPKALVADEAIDNRDRNLGNILWDGTNVAWIDHERALGLSSDSDANKLAVMSIMSGNHMPIQRAAVAISLALGSQAIIDASAACGCSLSDTTGFVTHVSTRLPALAARVLDRFPQPTSLFNP